MEDKTILNINPKDITILSGISGSNGKRTL